MMSLKVSVLLLSLLAQLCCSLPAAQSEIPHVPGAVPCEQLKPFFMQNNISDFHPVTSTASVPSMCESSSLCCTPSMETILLKSTSREFRDALRVASLSFRHSYTETLQDIEGQVLERIKGSTVKTQAMFQQLSDSKFNEFVQTPIAKLFEQLESSVKTQNSIDISESLSEFFENVFVYLHGQSSADFAQCVRKTQAELRPFGEIPRRLTVSVTRNLESFHALQESMRLAAELLDQSSQADLSNECAVALMKATSCAQCGGFSPAVRTCHGLCANVARGCLAHVSDVDQPWNEMLESMERIVSTLLDGRAGSRDILASIESRLSEAVLHALENAPMIDKKVRKICGEVVPAAPATWTSLKGDAESEARGGDDVPADDGSLPADLGARLRTLLASARGFFASLPDLVCSDKTNRFHGQADSECWNGQRLAEYTKPIVGTGTGAQKYNPEVRVPRAYISADFAQISDKLRHARLVLNSKTVVAPEPDSLLMADFGSGSGDQEPDGSQWPGSFDSDTDFTARHRNFDDEGGSGSGDGEIDREPSEPKNPKTGTNSDLDFVDETTTRASTKGPAPSAASPQACSKTGFVSLLALILYWGSLHWF